MRFSLLLIALTVAGNVWGQIDTRISPAPGPSEKSSQEPPKTSGVPLVGFLGGTLASDLKGLEGSLALSESATNQYGGLYSSSYDEFSRISGSLSLRHESLRYSLLAQYAAGTDAYVKHSYLDDQFHEIMIQQGFKLGRWDLLTGHSFNYLPQSSFGFDPSHLLGNGVQSFDSQLGHAPDVFTPLNVIERVLSNQATVQHGLGPRSRVALSGSFDDIHFSGGSTAALLVDSETATAAAQYSYTLRGNSAIGAGYEFAQSRAIGIGTLFHSHTATGSYSYDLGKRLVVRATGGFQFPTFQEGGREIALGTLPTFTLGATYTINRISLSGRYFHGVNPSSSYFLGTKNDDVSAALDIQLSRQVGASLSIGHGRNHSLGSPSTTGPSQLSSTYLTATVEKHFNRSVSAFLSYSLQTQATNQSICELSDCTSFPMVNTGMIGIRLRLRTLLPQL